jgi:hypothetical protein
MPGWEMNEPLDLKTLGIEARFQREYKRVMAALEKGDKGTVTIKLEIKRDKDMETLVDLTTSVSSTAPAKRRRTQGRIGEKGIFVEAVPEPQDNVVTLFERSEQ